MGGCCCCSSKGHELINQYPDTLEDDVPPSMQRVPTVSGGSGHLVDTNLDTSSPDTFKSPPAPTPYNMAGGSKHSPLANRELCVDKSGSVAALTPISESDQDAGGGNAQDSSEKCAALKELDRKGKAKIEFDDTKEQKEEDVSKSVEPALPPTEEEDVCPICFEDYNPENPRFTTQCDHDFHYPCIVAWNERSKACPVCSEEISLDAALGS